MNFSGENFILTPKTLDLSFSFSNVSVLRDSGDGIGVVHLGFSGENSNHIFKLSGNKIIDPDDKYVFSFEDGIPFNLSGDMNASYHKYDINDRHVVDGKPRSNFAIERLIVNTSDCSLNMNVEMFCPVIRYDIETDPFFYPRGKLAGKITNHSNTEFKVLASDLSQEDWVPNFTGLVTGYVPGPGILEFYLYDVANYISADADATLNLQTSIGDISHVITSSRASGVTMGMTNFFLTDNDNYTINSFFSGSGDSHGYTWLPWHTQYDQKFIAYTSTDFEGNPRSKTLYCSLENISPATGTYYTGTYATGFRVYDKKSSYCVTGHVCSDTQYTTQATCEAAGTCSDTQYTTQATCENATETWTPETWDDIVRPIWQCSGSTHGSGIYSTPPAVEFLTYSKVTGLGFNSNNIFTYNTPEKFPIFFSGYPGEVGAEASGFFLTEPFVINLSKYKVDNVAVGDYNNNDSINWKRVTGYEITNEGTGYTKMPAAIPTTGLVVVGGFNQSTDGTPIGHFDPFIPGTGRDMAYRKDLHVFGKFAAKSHGELLAGYLTGIPYFHFEDTYGVWRGAPNDEHYYLDFFTFTGVVITNQGSGYDRYFLPHIRAKRDPSDTFFGGLEGDDFSGEFLWNESGTLYDFTKVWNLETGAIGATTYVSDYKTSNLTTDKGYGGSAVVGAVEDSFFANVYFDNLDIDEPIVVKLAVSGEDTYLLEEYITGKNMYSTATGMAEQEQVAIQTFTASTFNINYFGS